jgi:hypothetical protein
MQASTVSAAFRTGTITETNGSGVSIGSGGGVDSDGGMVTNAADAGTRAGL